MYGDLKERNLTFHTSSKFIKSESWVKVAYDRRKMEQNKASSNKCMKMIQKFLYFSILVFLCFLLAMQITDCIKTYINFPTYVETKIVSQDKAIFPAMTICPVKDGYKKEVLQVR